MIVSISFNFSERKIILYRFYSGCQVKKGLRITGFKGENGGIEKYRKNI